MRDFSLRRLLRPAVTALAVALVSGGARAEPATLSTALSRTLLTAGASEAVSGFYADRAHAPLWLTTAGEPTPRAQALVAAVSGAEGHGLSPARYDAAALERAVEAGAPGSTEEAAGIEQRMTEVFLRYGRDVSSGLLTPRRLDRDLDITPPRPDPSALLRRMAGAGSPAALLAGLAPQHPDYAALRDRLRRYRGLVEAGGWGETVPSGPTLEEGERSDRVPVLRRRLGKMGDLPASAATGDVIVAANEVASDAPNGNRTGPADPTLYDARVAGAVKRFQARHGLNEDGLLGPATLRAVNRSAAFRLRQIVVNLERLRWLNKPLGERHVMVNLAGFRVALVEDGEETFTSRVIVGKTRFPTVEFSDRMEYMVINPEWHVPASIARNELLPALKKDPSHLADNNMELVGVDMPAEMIAWDYVTPSSFPGRVKQRPGPANALGRVKFMFPNEHAIYLHDTPTRSLFRRDRRAYSHGCVRVMKPLEFAYRLLEGQVADPEARFSEWLDRGKQVHVTLDRSLPVHLTYRTAPVRTGDGDHFRGDVYDRDALVADALQEAGVHLPQG